MFVVVDGEITKSDILIPLNAAQTTPAHAESPKSPRLSRRVRTFLTSPCLHYDRFLTKFTDCSAAHGQFNELCRHHDIIENLSYKRAGVLPLDIENNKDLFGSSTVLLFSFL